MSMNKPGHKIPNDPNELRKIEFEKCSGEVNIKIDGLSLIKQQADFINVVTVCKNDEIDSYREIIDLAG